MVDYNTFVRDVRSNNGNPVSYKPDSALAGSLETGEFAAWDATNKLLKRYVRDGTAGKFIGISRDSMKGVRRLGNQAALDPDRVSTYTAGVHDVLGTAAETYKHGDEVYMNGTDTTKVTTVVGSPAGIKIGVVWLPDGTTKSGAVRVPILIDPYTVTQA